MKRFNAAIIKSFNFFSFLGVGLVGLEENATARYYEKRILIVLVGITLLLLSQWEMGVHETLDLRQAQWLDWLTWCLFVLCYVTLLFNVTNRMQFIRNNWLLLVVIILGVFILATKNTHEGLLLNARAVLAFFIFLSTLRFLLQFFFDGRLWTTLAAALVLACVFGLLVAGIDPSIHSGIDGIWWAVATLSTVGYGDVVPANMWGRIIGVVMVFVGLGVFVVITANLLSIILRSEHKESGGRMENSESFEKTLTELYNNQLNILRKLDSLKSRLDHVENEKK